MLDYPTPLSEDVRSNSFGENAMFSSEELGKLVSAEHRKPSDSHSPVSWMQLTSCIVLAVHQLNHSIKQQSKQNYTAQAAAIINAIRQIMDASGTLDLTSSIMENQPSLISHHEAIMKCLSRLAITSKQAARIWPPPNASIQLRKAAQELLLAVRHFISEAQDLELSLKMIEENEESCIDEVSVVDITARLELCSTSLHKSLATFTKSVQKMRSKSVYEMGNLNKPLTSVTFGEVSNALSPFTSQVLHNAKELLNALRDLLVLAEDLKLLEMMQNEWSVRLDGYIHSVVELIGNLVFYAQALSDPSADIQALHRLLSVSLSVDNSAKAVLIMLKCIVEANDEDDLARLTPTDTEQPLEWKVLQDYSFQPKRRSELLLMRRATMSAVPSSSIIGAPSVPKKNGSPISQAATMYEEPPPLPPKFQSVDSLSFPKRDKLRNVLGENIGAKSPVMHQNGSIDSMSTILSVVPFMSHDYKDSEILLNAEGSIKGGTLPALVEKLTSHEANGKFLLINYNNFFGLIDWSFTNIFLLTYRSFTSTEELLELLFKRFLLTPPGEMDPSLLDQWKEKKLGIVRLR